MLMGKRSLTSKCLGVLLLSVVFSIFLASMTNAFSGDEETDVGDSGSAFSIENLKRFSANQRSINEGGAKRDHKKVMAHFKQLKKELEQQAEELESINREIQKINNSTVIYIQHQEKIKDSLLALVDYLEFPDDDVRNVFIEKAADLDQSIRVLFDGLLGQHALSPDVMAIIRDDDKCHDQPHFREHVNKSIWWRLIATGINVCGEYQRIISVTEPKWSSFNTTPQHLETSLTKLDKRVNDMIVECEAGERNVRDEMRNILKATTTEDRKTVADSLLKFLDAKYDTKKWFVMVHKNSNKSLDFIWTGKFHHISDRKNAAYAISVDRDEGNFSETRNSIDTHLKEFQIPIAFSANGKRSTGVEIETIVSPSVEWKDFIFTASNSVKYYAHTSYWPTVSSKCPMHVFVIVTPTKQISSTQSPSSTPHLKNPIECSYDPINAAENYGPLRNEFVQAYLSVQGDSIEEGASIIWDREWRNSPGQKWKFVDGQLRNEFGKCLTKTKRFFSLTNYVYQFNCEHKWRGQNWTRHGLQIFDDKLDCLTIEGKDSIFVITSIACDSSPKYLWYNWKTDCEDAVVISKSFTNGSRPLRNEFSRLFLSVDEKEYGTENPWSNRPTQLWKFEDGMLMNDDGKCLAGKGWYVQKVDCDADRMGNNGHWTYNEKRQIISKNGYCLSDSGNDKGSVYYDHCKDEPRQRWRLLVKDCMCF